MAGTLTKTETTTVVQETDTAVLVSETQTTEITLDDAELEPDFVFADDGERPMVRDYGKLKPKFMLGDQVRLVVARGRTEGPFQVESVDKKTLTYRLCDARGKSAKAGKGFGERDLVLDDPFA